MAKRDNTVRLADKYELADLEPDVDPEKAAAFLAGNNADLPKSSRRSSLASRAGKRVPEDLPSPASTTRIVVNREHWTSRTIRLRQSTATALTKAACAQKSNQAEDKLKPGDPVTVQEIADHGIRLALAELGYTMG